MSREIMASEESYLQSDFESLLQMLSMRRPHGSKTEEKFITRFLEPVGIKRDKFGNCYKLIPGEGDWILWSSHVDTVHHSPGNQLVRLDSDFVRLNKKSKSNCLGADDTAGVWLMLEMIKAKKPGLYVFHRGEECGGLGSSYIAKFRENTLTGIKAAIALDRKGYDSVITHQFGQCCSREFAESLADAIGLGMKPDDTGVFTDTANYTDIIPECTNLSVGYFAQHTAKESLDWAFLCELRDKLINMDSESLAIVREPGEDDEDSLYDWLEFDSNLHDRVNGQIGKDKESKYDSLFSQDDSDSTLCDLNLESEEIRYMARACRDYPDIVARLIRDYGISLDAILQAIGDESGDYIPF